MRPYSVEIFKPDLSYRVGAAVSDITYKEDYLSTDKNEISVIAPFSAEKYDYIRISRGSEEYTGLITEVTSGTDKSKNLVTLTYEPLMELLNTDFLFDTSKKSTQSLEDFIVDGIKAMFVSNSDTLQNITGLEVTATSSTTNWELHITPAESGGHYNVVNLLTSVIVPAMSKYRIKVSTALDPQNKKLIMTVGVPTESDMTIEADLPNILSKNVLYEQADTTTNKLVLYKAGDYATTITYYLHSDLSYNTTDSDRITPVVCEGQRIEVPDGETFASLAQDSAANTFGSLAFKNLIELTVKNDDPAAQDMIFGRKINVISGGTTYTSILTGIEIGKTTTLILGTIRLDLTKILKK